MSDTPRHFLDLSEVPSSELRAMLDTSRALKARTKRGVCERPLAGKTLAMIFDKPSTRTRVSFDVGMRQLGGESIMLTGQEMQLGRGETFADTARVLSRYVDAIMIRIPSHEALIELARHATVPVINGLTRRSHPCQVLADVMTFEEHRGDIKGRTVAWTGDANNVMTSWAHAADRFGFTLKVACPPELAPRRALKEWIKEKHAPVEIGSDPEQMVRGADCVVTDTWVSMGDKDAANRHNMLKPYQVNTQLMSLAKPDALFMHCLPAHRGDEVTDEVIDGPQSVVFDEAAKAHNEIVTRDVTPDPAVAALVSEAATKAGPIANKPVGTITADLLAAGNAAGESTLGDVIADAQLDATKSNNAQIAMTNPGGIRADITYASSPKGEGDGVVTYGEAFTVQPFSNIMQTITLTGANLKNVLEQQWSPSGTVRPLQISSSLHYTWSASAPIGSKVSNITVNGVPVDPAGSYRVSVNNFLAAGGDGFTEFTKGTNLAGGPIDLDALVSYFGAHPHLAPPPADRVTRVA